MEGLFVTLLQLYGLLKLDACRSRAVSGSAFNLYAPKLLLSVLYVSMQRSEAAPNGQSGADH